MFYEYRQYWLRPGTRDRWVALMHEKIVPFQKSHGMQVVGCFTVEDDPDAFVWIRRFDSEAQREQQYEAVYKSSTWLDVIKPHIDEMLLREKMKVTRIVPTSQYQGTANLDD